MTSLGEAQELPSFLPSPPSLDFFSVHVFIYLLELSWEGEGVWSFALRDSNCSEEAES